MTSKAYRVTIADWNLEIIVAAPTRGKAKQHQYLTSIEMGFNLSFLDFSVKRAPEFDSLAACESVKSLGYKYTGARGEELFGCYKSKEIIYETL